MRQLASSFARVSRRRPAASRAFTLIELILVLALMAIAVTFVAANLSRSFKGRALGNEARRLLSLAQYGQSRAVSEGVPMLLWVNAKEGTYGLTVVDSYADEVDGDVHAVKYDLDEGLVFSVPSQVDPDNVSESDDEKLGLEEGVVAIRFNPDGFADESSVSRIVIQRPGETEALEIVPTENRLGYQIRYASPQ